jgi:hypothetical protein
MKKLITITLLGISLFSLQSCRPEEGCTNKDATNYSPDAEKDDGSCKYTGEIVFWYNSSTSTNLINYPSSSLTFYVDGAVVGSTATNVYWTSAPDCGQNATITVSKDLGTSTSKSYSYVVKDNDDYIIWQGTANFEANTCTAIQLTF